jgi:hypothetical protein
MDDSSNSHEYDDDHMIVYSKKKILVTLGIATSVVLILLSISGNIDKVIHHNQNTDRFGISEIYPTKVGGREWYVNMNNPKEDRSFYTSSNISLTRQSDGSWQVTNPQGRLNVITMPGQEDWRDLEMTGYVKVFSIITTNSSNQRGNMTYVEVDSEDKRLSPEIDWRARGGRHSTQVPCEGTSLNGVLHPGGVADWKKEIWHTGGYTDSRGMTKATDSPIIGRWIGWKAVMYNNGGENNKSVTMESYIDDQDNNQWRKVNEVIDSGGWYANTPDKVFYSADCGRPKDYIITNSGPIATFRSDNIVWNFKYLSIREINPL